MIYDLLEKSLLAAIVTLGSLFAALAQGKKRKNLLAVKRHRPEP